MTRERLVGIFIVNGINASTGKNIVDAIMAEQEIEERRRTTPDNLTHIPQMTLRDWFAGQAMSNANGSDCDMIARDSYELADAMLAASEK